MLPYSPLHHLLLADVGEPLVMTSANVSDEPIAYRDDDARERLGEIADLFLVHDRPDPHAHRRLGGARHERRAADDPALARLRARGGRPAARRAAAAGLRRRAEERLLPGARPAGLGGPPHRRPGQLGDAALLSRRDRALRAPVRRARRRWWPTTCTRSTCPPSTRSSWRASSWSGVQHHHAHLAAVPGRARRAGHRGGRDLRRHRAGDRRHGVGRRGAGRLAAPASSGPPTCRRCACPAARRRSASRGGWPARGWWRPACRCPRAGSRWPSCAARARPRR